MAIDFLGRAPHTPVMWKMGLLILFLLIPVDTPGDESSTPTTLLTLPDGKILRLEVARTPLKKTRGLMFRPSLAEDQGMLFVFDRSETHPFWMKNTLIPLDILWLDHEKRIIHIESQVPPCKQDPCPVYGPLAGSLYVLEVNAGTAQRRGLQMGMPLRFLDIPQ